MYWYVRYEHHLSTFYIIIQFDIYRDKIYINNRKYMHPPVVTLYIRLSKIFLKIGLLLNFRTFLSPGVMFNYITERFSQWFRHAALGCMFGILAYSFILFSPMAYGMTGPTANELNSTMHKLKWMDSWEFWWQHIIKFDNINYVYYTLLYVFKLFILYLDQNCV